MCSKESALDSIFYDEQYSFVDEFKINVDETSFVQEKI
jgi:hypothetical protein